MQRGYERMMFDAILSQPITKSCAEAPVNAIQDVITAVKGIGPSTAEILARHGIESVRDLAQASEARLMAIPGFSAFRARQVLFDAQALLNKLEELSGSDEVSVEAISPSEPQAKGLRDLESDDDSEDHANTEKDKKKPKEKKKHKEKSKKKDKKEKSRDKSEKKGKKKK